MIYWQSTIMSGISINRTAVASPVDAMRQVIPYTCTINQSGQKLFELAAIVNSEAGFFDEIEGLYAYSKRIKPVLNVFCTSRGQILHVHW